MCTDALDSLRTYFSVHFLCSSTEFFSSESGSFEIQGSVRVTSRTLLISFRACQLLRCLVNSPSSAGDMRSLSREGRLPSLLPNNCCCCCSYKPHAARGAATWAGRGVAWRGVAGQGLRLERGDRSVSYGLLCLCGPPQHPQFAQGRLQAPGSRATCCSTQQRHHADYAPLQR